MIFLFWMIILSFLLFINLAAVGVGDTTVKFKMGKQAAAADKFKQRGKYRKCDN